MNNELRRRKILEVLNATERPVTATALAKQFSVSRQIIVGDIALLRAASVEIIATARGYLLAGGPGALKHNFVGALACRHTGTDIEKELEIIVNHGGTIIDIVVDHPYYGQVEGKLDISTHEDIECFIAAMNGAQPLSGLTGGIHLHHIGCCSEKVFEQIKAALERAGLLADSL